MRNLVLTALIVLLSSCVPGQIINPTLTPTTCPTSTHIPPTKTNTPLPPTSPATVKHTPLTYRGALLLDEIFYLPSADSPLTMATPLDENNSFLIVHMTVGSGVDICPEDLDWKLDYGTQTEVDSIGFGAPLGQESGSEYPNLTLFFGQLTSGCIIALAESSETVIDLVYVVSKDYKRGQIAQKPPTSWPWRVYIEGVSDFWLRHALWIDHDHIPTISCQSCTIEVPDGTENWTFTP